VRVLLSQGVRTEIDTIAVVVAAVDVPRGTTITSDILKTRDVPRDLVPEGAITRLEDAVDRIAFGALVKE
jgi:Flp pilus assembly protein CpaB